MRDPEQQRADREEYLRDLRDRASEDPDSLSPDEALYVQQRSR